jgi:hypothetical protein
VKEEVIKVPALERIKGIHKLSLQYNGRTDGAHQKRLLELMRSHIDEIEDLVNNGNDHFLTETGDLAVLCFELLLENNIKIDDILLKCFERYEKKLKDLIAAG